MAVAVSGPVPASQLGFVLPHEHLCVDNRIHHIPQDGIPANSKTSIEILGDLRVWPHALLDNLVLDDVDAILEDLRFYRDIGGSTIIELTPSGLGRDLAKLRAFSSATGVLVIGATGHYVARTHGDLVRNRTVEDLSREYVRELTIGEVRCGAIGEIGISREPQPDELKVLEAALLAQRETGAPIWIHLSTTVPMHAVLDWLGQQHCPLDRIVLCHTDYDLRDLSIHRRALSMGVIVEFDLFGMPAWNRRNFLHSPTDAQRMECVIALAAEGWGARLLLSQDVCQKIQLRRYGGFGYGHLIFHCREVFRLCGGGDDLWHLLTKENPARLLSWSPE